MHDRNAVSVVIPVHNGGAHLPATLEAVFAVAQDHPFIEVIAVDDGSTDGSSEVLRRAAAKWPLRIVQGGGRGAAAAINTGIRAASHPLIAQVDQDVHIDRDWLRILVAKLNDPTIAAAQGRYVANGAGTLVERAMALDLEQRYLALTDGHTDHVCTGNAVYRASALHQVGLFDESLGYGYDNDISYRLVTAGYRLSFCRDARSAHRWRDTMLGYLAQQYGFGYGRIDVVAKHPNRLTGDRVSPASMMSHGVTMALAVVLFVIAMGLRLAGQPPVLPALIGVMLIGLLTLERTWAAIRCITSFGDATALLFVPLHLLRDLAWVAAILVWSCRWMLGYSTTPQNSMAGAVRRSKQGSASPWSPYEERAARRILGVIPAYNEGANLAAVVSEVRRHHPSLDILVIDDGSTDDSAQLLPSLKVRWLSFPERLGIGNAMRAGIRYAVRSGYDTVLRLDGDGQHAAEDIERLLLPLRDGLTDVVTGSRFMDRHSGDFSTRTMQRLLAACLSFLTGTKVTDPTSGFYALGPRALRLLAEHHPTGYPEPELRLFLSRNRLLTLEVPIVARPRLAGRTSLTVRRLLGAGARVFLAMIIVPLRRQIKGER